MRVLAVEDDHEFRDFLQMHFTTKHPDIELEVAADGEEALTALVRFKPDVVIVDSYMPGMGGKELYEKIKEQDPTVRVVSFSGSERGATWADSSVDKGGRNNLESLVAAIRAEGRRFS